MYTASKIASFFLKKAKDEHWEITNRKLQQLLYFSQAKHLGKTGKPLFRENIEAWAHGPTVPSLYKKYRKYGLKPIPPNNKLPEIDEEINALIDLVWWKYGIIDVVTLEMITQNEKPWLRGRELLELGETSVISKQSMKEFHYKEITK